MHLTVFKMLSVRFGYSRLQSKNKSQLSVLIDTLVKSPSGFTNPSKEDCVQRCFWRGPMSSGLYCSMTDSSSGKNLESLWSHFGVQHIWLKQRSLTFEQMTCYSESLTSDRYLFLSKMSCFFLYINVMTSQLGTTLPQIHKVEVPLWHRSEISSLLEHKANKSTHV